MLLNTVYLLLGTNLGNRHHYLKQAKKQILKYIGKIIEESSIYETESWGYKSENAFLNQVIKIETYLSPNDLLAVIHNIEDSLGRKRLFNYQFDSKPYIDRIIDIDILFYNDFIIHTEDLIIPHPKIQDRKFVLVPMAEIASYLFHPKLKKTIHELLIECKDTINVKKAENQKAPLPYRFIAIEGNIGTGKTAFATMLAEKYNLKLFIEQYSDNIYLPKFYINPEKYSFPLELSFLEERYRQIKHHFKSKNSSSSQIISDYSIFKSIIFAKVTLERDDFILYSKYYQIIQQLLPHPDLIIYLHKNISKLQSNIKKRNRPYEQNIPDQYLKRIETSYFEYFENQSDQNILMINTQHLDYVNNPEDFITLQNIIKEHSYKKGVSKLRID